MSIYIFKEVEFKFDFDYNKTINDVINESLDYIKCPYETEINVTLTDNEKINEINKEYRGMDKPTDVLSFPMIEYETPGEFDFLKEMTFDYFEPETGQLVIGDIIISVEKVKEQALKYNHSDERELAFLTAHSMFHLFGFDHEDDDEMEVMEKMQEEVLSNLKIER